MSDKEILTRIADAYRRIRNTARFLLANLERAGAVSTPMSIGSLRSTCWSWTATS